MTKYALLFLISVSLFSCNNNNRFQVGGVVEAAAGDTLFLEHTALLETTTIDSVVLDEKGDYEFQSVRPAFPDFYRLRLNNKVIAFSIDSCEEIIIDAKSQHFASDYKVTGSEASNQIKQLRISLFNIQLKVNQLTPNLSEQDKYSRIESIKLDIETHKELARKLILQNPRSTAAYYALYQKVNDTYLFSPYIKADKPYCGAVATSYNVYMPDYERTKNLYSLVMDAIKVERKARRDELWNEVLATSGTGYIDIVLNDKNNVERKLSQLVGNLILIDFSAYESKQSVNYTFALRNLYNKYHSRGFEIFQISLDQNKLLWQQATKNIPWVCVRDQNGLNTNYVKSYNISSIPTTFLMTKQGTIIARSLGFEELETEIGKNL